MAKKKVAFVPCYTVVQHSGAASDKDFTKGLEPREVASVTERDLVKKAGGIVFPDYGAASAFCDAEMFPPGHRGLMPKAPGRFAKMTVGELRVYVPADAFLARAA